MKSILKHYIRQYLKEATIPYSAREIDAKLQSKLSPNKTKKKVSFNRDKILKTLAEEAGPNTFISFVAKYGPDVPKFSTNPHAAFKTPHGNYAYPLTQKNLIKLARDFAIDEVNFAIDREFMIVYKITSPNTIVVQKDGSSNYGQLDKKSFKGLKSVSDRDFTTLARSYYYFMYSFFLQDISDQEFKSLKKSGFVPASEEGSQIADDSVKKANANIRAFRSSLNGVAEESDSDRQFLDTHFAAAVYSYFENAKNYVKQMSKKDLSNHIEEAISEIASSIKKITESNANKFYRRFPESEFHKVYAACFFLSMTYPNIKRQDFYSQGNEHDPWNPAPEVSRENGPLFSLLLKEVGIDAVIDRGSATIHSNEPEQAFVTHFGSKSQRENVEIIGTFNNIFNPDLYRLKHRKELYDSLYEIFNKNPRLFPSHSEFLKKFDSLPRYGNAKNIVKPFQISPDDDSQNELDKFIDGIQAIGLSSYGFDLDALIKGSIITIDEDYIEYMENLGQLNFQLKIELQSEDIPQNHLSAFKYLNNALNNFKSLDSFETYMELKCIGDIDLTKFFNTLIDSQDFRLFINNKKNNSNNKIVADAQIHQGKSKLEISQDFLNKLKSVSDFLYITHHSDSEITFEILDKESALSFRKIIIFNAFYSGMTFDFSKSGMSSEEIDKVLEDISKSQFDDDIPNINIIK